MAAGLTLVALVVLVAAGVAITLSTVLLPVLDTEPDVLAVVELATMVVLVLVLRQMS